VPVSVALLDYRPTLHTDDGDSDWDGVTATAEQTEASFAEATGSGYILIDADGNVVKAGGLGADKATKVWVA